MLGIFGTIKALAVLFAFLIAGAVGGFAAGYYWKTLISGKERKESPSDNAQQ